MKSILNEYIPFPFNLIWGSFGKIQIQFPVLNIFTSEIVINIEHLFLVISAEQINNNTTFNPSNESCENYEQNSQANIFSNKFKLENFSEKFKEFDFTKSISDNYFLKRIKLIISEIHIKYIHYHGVEQPFSFGIMINSFKLFPSNKTWDFVPLDSCKFKSRETPYY